MSKWWQNYRHRFTPWILWTWQSRVKQKTKPVDVPASPDAIAESLRRLFDALHANPNSSSQSTMKRMLGFVVERRQSTIADAGRGVFVAEGKISRGAVASLYPGTLYEAGEPVLFPSIGNAFVLRCVDGLLVDGKDRGISRRIYLSCAARDRLGSHAACDTTWLTPHPRVPLAVGQYVNNQPKDGLANVVYQEVDLSADFPSHLMKYVPNVFNSPDAASKRPVRLVALLALRDIDTEEELFSTYFTQVH